MALWENALVCRKSPLKYLGADGAPGQNLTRNCFKLFMLYCQLFCKSLVVSKKILNHHLVIIVSLTCILPRLSHNDKVWFYGKNPRLSIRRPGFKSQVDQLLTMKPFSLSHMSFLPCEQIIPVMLISKTILGIK